MRADIFQWLSIIWLTIQVTIPAFASENVEKWKVFELELTGPSSGNPYTGIALSARFTNGPESCTVEGFYDGGEVYRVRFMPGKEGKWHFTTMSNSSLLNGIQGSFVCSPAKPENHGPVRVKDTFYFAYADGKPHYSFGTTVYNWFHESDSLANLTLQTLKTGIFNKLRVSLFHLNFRWSRQEPEIFPYEGNPKDGWDYTRFNPAWFHHIETRIRQLDSLGIEADLIAFTYTNRMGFKNMGRINDERYIRYLVARLSAFKNVWWSASNEFDLLTEKSMDDWDHIIETFAKYDPYNRLLSIHNGLVMYDHSNPLITHLSIQDTETHQARDLREKYKKPVIYDECQYEGNTDESWGNITGEEMTDRFWRAFVNGGYAGHAEMYLHHKPVTTNDDPREITWALRGGVLHGTSPERIDFLRKIANSAPGHLKLYKGLFNKWMQNYSSVTVDLRYFLVYLNKLQPAFIVLQLPEENHYKVEIIDAWNMTIEPVSGSFTGKSLINLPEKPMTGLRITALTK